MNRTAVDWLMKHSLTKLWLIAGCILLPAALAAPGCGQDIPVVVSLRGAEGQLASVEITPTLVQTKQVTIQPAKPNGEIVLYLPASARGTLRLDVKGRDTHECVVEGTVALEVEPTADGALQAVIPLTTQCELKLTVQGNGIIQVLDDSFKCDGHTSTTCTRSFKKGTPLTLMALENGIDSDLGLWEGACTNAPARCTLAMNQSTTVKMTFPRRRCGSSVAATGHRQPALA
jgi:hypothetical protein